MRTGYGQDGSSHGMGGGQNRTGQKSTGALPLRGGPHRHLSHGVFNAPGHVFQSGGKKIKENPGQSPELLPVETAQKVQQKA